MAGGRRPAGISTGPMMTSNFDALHQIVQTPSAVVPYSEALGDTRIIRLMDPLPAN